MRYGLADAEHDGLLGEDIYRMEDNGDQTYLGTDLMEPEDAMFSRDLKWVPEELNRLAGIIQEREEELKRVYEALHGHAQARWALVDQVERCYRFLSEIKHFLMWPGGWWPKSLAMFYLAQVETFLILEKPLGGRR